MVEIIPAILTNNFSELEFMVKRCEGVASRVQIDIVDGVFADNRTIEPDVLGKIDTDLNLDFHLMTKEPINWVERAVRGMADRIIGQVEMMSDQIAFVGKVAEVGLQVGLAIDLTTPVSALDPTILTNLDSVLVMAVKAGFGGQEFSDEIIKRIKRLSELRGENNYKYKICVDGGITEKNVQEVHAAGGDEIVIGKRIFDGDLGENIKKMQEAAHN